MKFIKLVLPLMITTVSTAALSQIDDVVNRPSTETSKPGTLKLGNGYGITGLMKLILSRFYSLDIQGQVQEMNKDGVTERKYLASFSASGAIAHSFELDGVDRESVANPGTGAQLLPYTIKISQDGSRYLAVGAVGMKNLNSYFSPNGSTPGINKFLNNLDFIVLKWDRNSSFTGINSFELAVFNADVKLDILNSSKESRYLAITAGAAGGLSKTTVTLEDGNKIYLVNHVSELKELEDRLNFAEYINYRYGIEYGDNFSNGNDLKIGVSASHTFTHGGGGTYEQMEKVKNYEGFNERYLDWFKRTPGCSISLHNCRQVEYAALNGEEVPEDVSSTKVEKMNRHQVYVSPYAEFGTRTKLGSMKSRIGVGISANIPLRDVIKSESMKYNLEGLNRDLISAKLFINF